MEALLWVIPVLVVVVGLGLILARSVVSKFVRRFAARKLTWEERDQLSRKRELLAFDTLREFYAPRDGFQREWDPDKKKPTPRAWLSPYPKAVKNAWKAARKDAPTRLTLVRQQVAAAAASFTIETLPDEEQPYNSGADHFSIVLDLNGQPYEQVVGLAPALKSQLRLYSLEEADNGGDFGSVKLVGHAEPPVDRLEMLAPGVEFFKEHPAESPFELPLAVTERGAPWCLETHHTLIYGLTGSGKSSPLNGVIAQLAPFVRSGLVEIWMADLKGTLARPYGDSSLLTRVATTMETIERLVADFDGELMARIAELESLPEDEQDSFEQLTPSRKLKVLVFDEMSGTLIKASENRKSHLLNNATNVTLLGRELNFLVIGAGQIVRWDIMENLRSNIVNGVALRAENTGWSTFVLFGNHDDKRGPQFDASQIEVANRANGYKTAGIAYAKGEGGTPVRVRFANLSKNQVRKLAASFPPRVETAVTDSVVVVAESEPEEEFVFERATAASEEAFEPEPGVSDPEEEFVFETISDEEDEDDAFAVPRPAPRRSQVDDNAKVREWDDAKLARYRRAIEADSEKMRTTLWRGRLDAIRQEQRLRLAVAKYESPKASSIDGSLPDLHL